MIHNDEDGDNDAYDDDGDDDVREIIEEEWIRFLGGNSSSATKKYRGSNSSDGGNTGDGVKIAGGVIGSGGGIVSEELKETAFLMIAVGNIPMRDRSIVKNIHRGKSILNIGSRVVGRRHRSVYNPVWHEGL
ncbi:hypothetical protein Tco_0307368 [Tanacetum coccineum]